MFDSSRVAHNVGHNVSGMQGNPENLLIKDSTGQSTGM
jgi:hypothetical protein